MRGEAVRAKTARGCLSPEPSSRWSAESGLVRVVPPIERVLRALDDRRVGQCIVDRLDGPVRVDGIVEGRMCRVEQCGSRSRLKLPFLAGGLEPPILARLPEPAFLHLVEVPGQRLGHVRIGRRHSLVQRVKWFL